MSRITLAAAAAFFMLAIPAFAQSRIDFAPVVEVGLELLNIVLVALLGWIALLVQRKLGLDKLSATAAANQMLHDGIQRGIDALESEIRKQLIEGRTLKVDVSNPLVGKIAQRMIDLSPDLLKRLNVDRKTLNRLVAEKLAAQAAKNAEPT